MLAYFDCFSGIAGDMTIAALIDLGLDPEFLRSQLASLNLRGYEIRTWTSSRRSISGTRFDVEISDNQPHRSYRHIRGTIEDSAIEDEPKSVALSIFDCLADAESHVHGVPKDEVHFHEIGAVDSIVDIVGTAIGIGALGIDSVVCSPLPLCRGFVKTEHGTIPTPAPATLEILKGVPVVGGRSTMELVTPTGAAIAKTLADSFGDYPPFVPDRIGYGLGTADPEAFPNALRVVLGEKTSHPLVHDRIAALECHVDDLDGRILGHLMERFMADGALDVSFSPIQMKKNRPGTYVRILVPQDRTREFAERLLNETTTIGVRVHAMDRITLPRRAYDVTTSLGTVVVKELRLPDGRIERRPEYESLRHIAQRTGKPLRDVMRLVDAELENRTD